MTPLLRAELLRLTSRRMARILAALVLLVVGIVTVRAFFVSDRDFEGARRDAVAAAERDERRINADGDRFRRICEAQKARGEIAPEQDCGEFGPPPGETIEVDPSNYYSDPRLFARTALPAGARGVAGGIAFAAFLVGASFIGAEWHHGTMQALLFWEPRRGRVLAAKALALVIGTVVFTLAVQLLVYGMTYLTAATRGSTDGVTAGLHVSALLTVLRGLVVVSVCALLGYAVSGLARFTAAALGMAAGYFILVENLIRGLRPGWQRYLFTENVSAVLLKRVQVAPASTRSLGDLGDVTSLYWLSGVRGAVTLTVYLGLLIGAFYYSFTRRDVT